jgi:uncharacterized membrane protein YdjX (TVP38/TMEM64 family)
MSAATITAIGAPRSMTTWIKLGLAAIVIGAIGCFLLARALGRDALSKLLKVETVFC